MAWDSKLKSIYNNFHDNKIEEKLNNKYKVFFIGHNSYSYLSSQKLKLYDECMEYLNTNKKSLKKSIDYANKIKNGEITIEKVRRGIKNNYLNKKIKRKVSIEKESNNTNIIKDFYKNRSLYNKQLEDNQKINKNTLEHCDNKYLSEIKNIDDLCINNNNCVEIQNKNNIKEKKIEMIKDIFYQVIENNKKQNNENINKLKNEIEEILTLKMNKEADTNNDFKCKIKKEKKIILLERDNLNSLIKDLLNKNNSINKIIVNYKEDHNYENHNNFNYNNCSSSNINTNDDKSIDYDYNFDYFNKKKLRKRIITHLYYMFSKLLINVNKNNIKRLLIYLEFSARLDDLSMGDLYIKNIYDYIEIIRGYYMKQ